jgi:hypothetical protein
MVDAERYVWLCFCRTFITYFDHNSIMSNPPSTGSPLITSSSVDSNLLPPRAGTSLLFTIDTKPHLPQTRPSRPVLPNKTSGNHSFASETHDRDSANYRLAQETNGSFLGAMPPPKILKRFLPISQDTPECPNWKGAFASVSIANKEVDMYTLFVSGVLCFCTHCALPTSDR